MSGLISGLVGIQTQATQPAVFAFNNANDSNVTGDGATVTADLDVEVYDQNADFASNTFTAPVTGIYHISGCMACSDISTSTTAFVVKLVTTHRPFIPAQGASVPRDGSYHWSLSADADMDAGDTLTLTFVVHGMGSNAVDIRGDGSDVETFLSVRLVA